MRMFVARLTLLFLFSLASVCSPSTVLGQGKDLDLLGLGDFLYESKSYDLAITEYMRYIFLDQTSPSKYYAYYKIGMCYMMTGESNSAVSYLRQSLLLSKDRSTRGVIKYRLANAYVHAGQYELAKVELIQAGMLPLPLDHETARALMLGMVFLLQGNADEAVKVFEHAARLQKDNGPFYDSMNQVVSSLTHWNDHARSKNPRAAKLLSTILPGAGQVYAGKPLHAINAMGINALTVFLVVNSALNGSYRDAALLTAGPWLRYYRGNRLHAEEDAILANQHVESKRLNDLIEQLLLSVELLHVSPMVLQFPD